MIPAIMISALFLNGFAIEQDTLSNGLVIMTIEAHKIPLVYGKILINAGSVFDPSGKEGIANVTGELLTRGTSNRTADELFDAIESVGGDLNAFTDEDYSGISGRVLSKDLELFISLMADCIMNPVFDPAEVAKITREVASQIKADNDDPWVVGEGKMRELIFGPHSLNHVPYGFENSVVTLKREDIGDFYGSFYSPNEAFVVLVGDFDTPSILATLEKYFGAWKIRSVKLPECFAAPLIPAIDRPKGLIVKRDISQAYIFLGFAASGYYSKDWIPTRIMNNILGGSGLTCRISDAIREKKGLAYSAGSYYARFGEGGFFEAYVQTKRESATDAISTLVGEIAGMQKGAIKKELDDARNFYIGHFPLTFDTYRELADFAAQIEIEKLGLDYAETFPRTVEQVTLDDIEMAAQKHLSPGAYYLVVVGDLDPEDIEVEGIDWIR
ncbi:MAG TPA: pitrilysin family protein [bacterium]